ncbi:MAG: heavy metal-binding domain-containing protein [Hyphomicrobiaceae bacterium]|nr:heavy metal-binding domain-containing protein [Hyphomicrobiaceae bacterium]
MNYNIRCTTTDSIDGNLIELGDIIYSTAASSSNVIRDVWESIRNITGGK